MDLPELTEADIHQYVTARSFERGYDYFESGMVGNVVRRERQLTGEVQGSDYQPYRVTVTLDEEGIAGAYCTCPYDWGGYCKHIVAVLLTYIHEGEEVASRPGLESLLTDLDRDQLQTILLAIAQWEPGLVEVIEREVDALRATPEPDAEGAEEVEVNPAAIRRQIRADIRRLSGPGYDSWGETYGDDPTDPLIPHMDHAYELLEAGHARSALQVLQVALEAWTVGVEMLDEYYLEYWDEGGEGMHTLGQVLAEALLSVDLTGAEQTAWQERLDEWWDMPLTDGLEIAGAALEQGWDYEPLVRAMQGNITEQGAWAGDVPWYADELAEARLNVLERQGRTEEFLNLAQAESQILRYVDMLIRQGRVEEAVKTARDSFHRVEYVVPVVESLDAHGAEAEAMALAEHGLTLEGWRQDVLGRWLRDKANAAGKGDLALKAAEAAFRAGYWLEDYQAAERVAGERWPEVRERLLAEMEKAQYANHKVQIYLHEGLVEKAMRTVEGSGTYSGMLPQVIDAAKGEHPDWAIRQCQQQAEVIMDAGRSKEYAEAARWLSRAKEIYLDHGRGDEWRAYIDGVLEKHHRKYSLVPRLEEIR